MTLERSEISISKTNRHQRPIRGVKISTEGVYEKALSRNKTINEIDVTSMYLSNHQSKSKASPGSIMRSNGS